MAAAVIRLLSNETERVRVAKAGAEDASSMTVTKSCPGSSMAYLAGSSGLPKTRCVGPNRKAAPLRSSMRRDSEP